MKFHFLLSIIFVLAATFMALQDNKTYRLLLLIAVLILYYAAFLVFAVDYDKKQSELISSIKSRNQK